jgi:hypothetical protein
MAGKVGTFVVGARAKIKLDGKTCAFATSVNYSVDVTHVPVEVLGSYEVVSYEPVGYRVTGSLTVVRYTANGNATAADQATDNKGNSVFTFGDAANSNRIPAQFNPGNLILSETFDLEVYDRRDGINTNNGQVFAKIQDARFERRSGGVNAKGLLEEQYSFNGILFHDDAATVTKSGPNATP